MGAKASRRRKYPGPHWAAAAAHNEGKLKNLNASLEAKKYWMNATAKFCAGSTVSLGTEHKLDPWPVSSWLYFRF